MDWTPSMIPCTRVFSPAVWKSQFWKALKSGVWMMLMFKPLSAEMLVEFDATGE